MILKKKEKSLKKITFQVPNVDFEKFKSMQQEAQKLGFEIDITGELKKYFLKILRKAESEIKKIKENEPAYQPNSIPDSIPEIKPDTKQ